MSTVSDYNVIQDRDETQTPTSCYKGREGKTGTVNESYYEQV